MNTDPSISDKKIIVHLSFVFFLYSLSLFISAGTLNWPEAWLFLAMYFAWMIYFLKYLQAHNSELLRERLSPSKAGRRDWDKKFVNGTAVLFLAVLSVSGLDAVRYHWTMMPFQLKIAGFLGLIPTFALFIWVTRENRYIMKVYEIRPDMGHKVVTTGPYRYVRHPMYVANILLYICMPLMLGSLYAFIPAFLSIVLFILRSHLEDRALQEELEGYKEYASNVKSKLIPMLW